MKELSTMMGWYYGGAGWLGWLGMAVVMVAFWGLVVFAVVAVFRGLGKPNRSAEQVARKDALRILDERFARGELDETEYHARQDVLRGTSGGDRTGTR